MNLLIVAATEAEIFPLIRYLKANNSKNDGVNYTVKEVQVHLCLTGIGIAATTFHLTKALSHQHYAYALQAGIAGAFFRTIPLGSVWRIGGDRFADLGAEDNQEFKDLFDLNLQQPEDFPFQQKKLPGCNVSVPVLERLPVAEAITVNTVSGNEYSIRKWSDKYQPALESMEGAAFHYVCRMEKIRFIQLRSVSNYVESRDKSRWNIPLAIENLNQILIRFLETVQQLP